MTWSNPNLNSDSNPDPDPDATRAGAEVVKQTESPCLSGLLYPGLQVSILTPTLTLTLNLTLDPRPSMSNTSVWTHSSVEWTSGKSS